MGLPGSSSSSSSEIARASEVPEAAVRARDPALDALRGSMMLLGLVVHTGNSYLAHSVPDAWGYADPSKSVVFDGLVYVIHVFRMPVFFLLAGLFAAKMLERRGAARFAADRARRVALPLLLFLVPSALFDALAFAYAKGGLDAAVAAVVGFRFERLLSDHALGHLWFLQHLLVFYAALLALGLARVRRVVAVLGGLLSRADASLFLAVPLAALLLGMPFAVLIPSGGVVPKAAPLVAYGLFFAAGLGLASTTQVLRVLAARAPLHLAGGAACAGLTLAALFVLTSSSEAVALDDGRALPGLWAIACSTALATWLCALGIVGAAVRWATGAGRGAAELAEASYWIYLVHHGQTVLFAGLLGAWAAPALVKATVVVAVTAGVSFSSWRLVRATWLGALLGARVQR